MSDRYRILITTDSICDLPKELIEKYSITIMPCYVVTDQGRFVDGEEMNTRGLIQFLGEKGNFARSEMPRVEEYQKFFSDHLMKAERIIHISMGRYASPGYFHAKEAAERLQGVTVCDSGQLSSGLGLVVREAALLVEEGKGYEEICKEIGEYAAGVSSTFIAKDLELMYRSNRISRATRDVCDRLLLHLKFTMKKSRIHVKGIIAGHFENVIRSYIRSQFVSVWRIDTEILFITHVGLSDSTLEEIRNEIEKYVHFEKIYFIEATSTIACNCGNQTLGLSFAKKRKIEKQTEKSGRWKEKLSETKKIIADLIAKDEFPIRQRIMNLILLVALIGGAFSDLVNVIMGAYESAAAILVMLMIAALCLYLSVFHRRWKEAGVLLCLLANTVIFPVMYFVSGGLRSGMPVWFVLGLLFDWQILTGWICFVVFGANFAVMVACIFWGEVHPEYVLPVTDEYMRNDIIQTVFFVVIILGAIYKYQSFVYEKQKEKIQEHEAELLRSNSAKDLFLANMSHEIRTPINGIMGMNSMLLRECGDNAALQEYSRNIQTSSQTLLALVNDILDISKIEAGKFEINPVEYDIFSVINDCYQIAHSRSVAKGLEFELDFDPAIPSGLYGDEMRIRQVINNLLSNAVKYTEQGTVRLAISMEKRGDAVMNLVICVHDSGIGIRDEDKEKIFKSFSRVDEKKNRAVEGSGLGLNLTSSLVELMNGKIQVESVYGQGSTFTVWLPQQIRNRIPAGDFAKKYQESLTQWVEEVETVHTVGASALVVDDVPMNLLVAKGILKPTGMQVDTADSGKQALEMVCRKKYDIIFLDHVMPEMDGIACLHKMKEIQNNQNQKTPVIVLTANVISGIREEYIRTGFQDYLSKPIQEKELYDILRTFLPKEKIAEHGEAVENRMADLQAGPQTDVQEGSQTDLKKSRETEPDEPEGKQEDQTVRTEEQQPQDQQEGTSFARLQAIPEIDTARGLSYCMNDEDFYLDIVQEYLRGEKSTGLQEALEKEDWEQYRILVHALKSTSMNIGAKKLSEEARISELACKDGDYDTVKDRHEALMQDYQSLRDKMGRVF